MQFELDSISKKGNRRKNEDFVDSLIHGSALCCVVADGLGGHSHGEIASRLAVETVLDSFRRDPEPTASAIEAHILAAHTRLASEGKRTPVHMKMGCTLTVLVCSRSEAIWGHVGDARLYHFRADELVSQTKDHSLSQKLVDSGRIFPEELRHHEDRNRLLKTVGVAGGPLEPSVIASPLKLVRGDAFLLCTDGFWEFVLEGEMADSLERTQTAAKWLKDMELILQKRVGNGEDNYTALTLSIR